MNTLTSTKLLKKVSSSGSKGINVRTYDTVSHLQHLMKNTKGKQMSQKGNQKANQQFLGFLHQQLHKTKQCNFCQQNVR